MKNYYAEKNGFGWSAPVVIAFDTEQERDDYCRHTDYVSPIYSAKNRIVDYEYKNGGFVEINYDYRDGKLVRIN